MKGLAVSLFVILAVVYSSNAMPLFDDYGLQEDRGFQSCSEDCAIKRNQCLECPELAKNNGDTDDIIARCQMKCTSKYNKCIGGAGDTNTAPTGCHKKEIRDLY